MYLQMEGQIFKTATNLKEFGRVFKELQSSSIPEVSIL
jgi:hypothetical protein